MFVVVHGGTQTHRVTVLMSKLVFGGPSTHRYLAAASSDLQAPSIDSLHLSILF